MQTFYVLINASADEIIVACTNNRAQIVHSTLDKSEDKLINANLKSMVVITPEDAVEAYKLATGWTDVELESTSNTLDVYKAEYSYMF